MRIVLNPKMNLLRYTDEFMEVSIDFQGYKIAGNLLEKYFIKHFINYIAPTSIDEMYFIIKKKIGDASENEFLQVVNLLLSKKIIILYKDEQESEYGDKRKILIINLSLKESEILIKKQFCSYKIDIISDIDKFYENVNGLKNYDLIVPIFWSWYETYLTVIEDILKEKKKKCKILPVISNMNYFSIGPYFSMGEKLKNVAVHLRSEKSRYSYIDISANNYFAPVIMTAFLQREVAGLSENQKFKSKTLDYIITYNYKSGKLENKKIKYVRVERVR